MWFNSLQVPVGRPHEVTVDAYLPPWNIVFHNDQGISFSYVPDCIDFYLNGKFVQVARWADKVSARFGSSGSPPGSANFEFRSNSQRQPVVKWSVADGFGRAVSEPLKEGVYQLVADGRSSASPYDFKQPVAEFVFGSDPLGCTLTPQGHLKAGTEEGSIVVLARLTNCNPCFETAFTFDLVRCDSLCNCEAPGTGNALNNSVDFRMHLGRSRSGGTAGFLRFRTKEPPIVPLAGLLTCDFARPDLHVLRNPDGALRQVRMLDGAADISPLSSNRFQVDFYDREHVSAMPSNGLYLLTGAPFQSHSFEAVDNNPEHLRIRDSLTGTVHDYLWETNGWTLVSGNGLRRERVQNEQQGTRRIETRTVLDASGVLLLAERKTYDLIDGIELVTEEVSGAVPFARTNRYEYGPGRWLREIRRSDGSWEVFHTDDRGRLSEHFRSFLNSTPTTNSALCRVSAYDYSSAAVPSSGDTQALAPNTPRRVIHSLLGSEIGREYNVVRSASEQWHFRTSAPGLPWNAPANEVTRTITYQDVVYLGLPARSLHPDGTLTIISMDRAALASYPGLAGDSLERRTVSNGAPSGSFSSASVQRGIKTEEYLDPSSRVICKITSDIQSGLFLNCETNFYDDRGRLTNTTYLDGTSVTKSYDCCGVRTVQERDGSTTVYGYDALQRQVTVSRGGITTSNQLDAAGNTVATWRWGTDGSVILIHSNLFDTAGETLATWDGRLLETRFTNYLDSAGGRVRITTLPNQATRIETYAADGSLLRVEGTAEHGRRYEYGVEDDGTGRVAEFSREIKLKPDGSDTGEWGKTYRDALGQTYRTVYPDGAVARSEFNVRRQETKRVDPEGVTTLFGNDNLGRQATNAVDINTNGVIDFGGNDRITFTVTDVVTNSALRSVVQRTRTFDYGTNGSPISNLVRIVEHSDDGLKAQTVEGERTNRSVSTYLGGGLRQIAEIQADGSSNVSTYVSERLLSVTHYAADGRQIAATSNEYDPHGRLWRSTDARNGTTTYTYNANDQIESVTKPSPATGKPPQTTTTFFDKMNRPSAVHQPDGSWVTNTYHLTGELHRSFGARTFPVEYTHDYAGRLQTMTTWQNAASGEGRATTTWRYDGQRGFLTNKEYADGKSVSYEYTPAGRLCVRRWARGIETTYFRDAAGELEFIDYSDDTPDVRYFRDRRGRIQRVEVGTGAAQGVWEYTRDDAGHILSEFCSYPALRYTMQAYHGFDELGRRTAYTNVTLGVIFRFAYDESSRLKTVSSRDVTVTYTYATNSSLVESITFQKAGITRLVTSKQHDLLNRLQSIINTPSGAALLTNIYDYNQANQRTNRLDPDGTSWRFEYDPLGQLTNGVHMLDQLAQVAGERFGYSFDDIANRTGTVTGGAPDGSGTRSASYLQNLVNQYEFRTNANAVDVSGQADAAATVTVNGQPTLRQGMRFWSAVPTDNNAGPALLILTNRAVLGTNEAALIRKTLVPPKVERFDFDGDGNETGDGLWIRTFDGENRLIRVQSWDAVPLAERRKIEHVYDYLGRRIYSRVSALNPDGLTWRLVTERRFWYDGWNMVGKTDIAKSPDPQVFLWGLDLSGSEQGAGGVGGLLAIFHPKALTETNKLADSFVCFDGNGNVTTLISADDGTVHGRFEHGPFGELLVVDGEAAERCWVRFSTKLQEPETGDYYYGYRFYSPSTGRWRSRDPLQERVSPNPYASVANSSQNMIDIDGRVDVTTISKFGAPCSRAGAQWRFSPANGTQCHGWIIQHVEVKLGSKLSSKDCCSKPDSFSLCQVDFYEAWPIQGNDIGPHPESRKLGNPNYVWPAYADDDSVFEIPPSTSGKYSAVGEIRFICDRDIESNHPEDWPQGDVGCGRSSHAFTKTTPSWWHLATTEASGRRLNTVVWDCCGSSRQLKHVVEP